MYKLDFKRAEEPEIKLPTSTGSQRKQENSSKIICFTDFSQAFDCVDHNKLENSERDGNTRLPCLSSEKPVCRSRMEQQTVSKLGKVYVKAVYCHPAYLTSIQVTSSKMLLSVIHWGKYNILGPKTYWLAGLVLMRMFERLKPKKSIV